jgi:hypothetical protein
MGYSNYYSLKVEGKITKKVKTSEDCECGITSEELNFCGKCGVKLIEKEIELEGSYVIEEFVKEYADGDAGYLLEDDGSTNESGSGYTIDDEIKEFSKKYSELTFILSCQWESGLSGADEPGTDYFFFKNGVRKKADVKIIYTNPFTNEIIQLYES